jgi:invasion protein IalB
VVIGTVGATAAEIDETALARASQLSQSTLVAQATPPAGAPPAGQTAQTPQAPKAPGWAVNCKSGSKEKALDCRLSQTVVTRNRQTLANVTFHFPPNPEKPEIIIQLPLGVLLPAGATVQVDENPAQQLTFRACNRNGCYAQAPLPPDVLAQLRKGKQVNVAFKNLAENEVKVPLQLDGFGDAYAKVPSS